MREHVPDSQADSVRAVTVRIGDLAGIVTESLDFCFGAIVTDTPYSKAFLKIEHTPGDDLHLVAVDLDDGAAV